MYKHCITIIWGQICHSMSGSEERGSFCFVFAASLVLPPSEGAGWKCFLSYFGKLRAKGNECQSDQAYREEPTNQRILGDEEGTRTGLNCGSCRLHVNIPPTRTTGVWLRSATMALKYSGGRTPMTATTVAVKVISCHEKPRDGHGRVHRERNQKEPRILLRPLKTVRNRVT